jgi:hypothetical protein
MGHADYAVLHRYVRLSSERDLGPLSDWAAFIVIDRGYALTLLQAGEAWLRS